MPQHWRAPLNSGPRHLEMSAWLVINSPNTIEADAICPRRTWLCFLSPTIFRVVALSLVESCWSFFFFFSAKLLLRNTGPLSFDQLPFITRLTSVHSSRPGVAVSSIEKPSLPGLGRVLCAQRVVPIAV